MRLGLFGGSFNPIHAGHLRVALRALAELRLDEVRVIPAKANPFKIAAPPVPEFFSDAVRWELVRAACEGFPALVPDDLELARGGTSYAIDTVRAFRARFPGAELVFITGEDCVPDLPRWREWETLRTLCRFVAYPRTPESSTEIRRRLAAGESADDLLPPAVARTLKKMAKDGRIPVRFQAEGFISA